MKNVIIILCLLTACKRQSGSYGSIIKDVTDKFPTEIMAQDVYNLAHVPECLYNSHTIRLKYVNNYEYTPTRQLCIDGVPACLSNELTRQEELNGFFKGVQKEMNMFYPRDTVLMRSAILDELIRELNAVASSGAKYRYVVLYSDCCINTIDFSCYDKRDLYDLMNEPDTVEHRLLRHVTPQNYSGVQVHIIFQPRNDGENVRFVIMSNFIKRMLEHYNATVTIQANLITQ